MNTYAQVKFAKRNGYQDVYIYYSRNKLKFRQSTGVKILNKDFTAKGSISTSTPNYIEVCQKIKETQDKVKALIQFYEKYR